jgi:uncharacterized protein YkwD
MRRTVAPPICAERPMALRADRRHGVGVNGARALRVSLALAALAATAILAEAAFATSHSEKALPSLNHQVIAAVNRFRLAHGLSALHESSALDGSARQHSLEMGRVGYFAHSSHNGTVFWKRIRRYYPARGHAYWSVGENLVWASPSLSVADAMKDWISSPPHLKNLLTARWRAIGVSAVRVVDAPGYFHGMNVVIITNDFGVRS